MLELLYEMEMNNNKKQHNWNHVGTQRLLSCWTPVHVRRLVQLRSLCFTPTCGTQPSQPLDLLWRACKRIHWSSSPDNQLYGSIWSLEAEEEEGSRVDAPGAASAGVSANRVS